MSMLLGCGEGLFVLREGWQKTACPLRRADFVAQEGPLLCAVDDAAHQLWLGGHVIPCPRDVAALRLWRGHALLLSGDTDCLTLYGLTGETLITTRVGIYPQDLCLSGSTAAVCGGADGCVHLLSLPELHLLQTYPLFGMTQRIAATDAALHVLCLTEEAGMQCELVRIDLATGRHMVIARWPGLPGAIAAGEDGALWIAASERLCVLPAGHAEPSDVYEGFGLIRHISLRGSDALVTDPVEGLCVLCGKDSAAVVYRGDVGQAEFG
ncbi:MAG: hypothetical protein IJ438_11655 [Clostridia bacterium]|nr:hypothetical protein [Clostridia bacterium]